MRRVLRFLVRYPVLQAAVILAGLLIWARAGLFDARLARAGGPCGHFCAAAYTNGPDAVNAVCGSSVFGSGFVRCAEEVPCGNADRCVFCCLGCAPPPDAPPGANGCWTPGEPTPTPTPTAVPPTPAPTATPNCGVYGPPVPGASAAWSPNFPVVAGQKPDSRVSVTFEAQGGPSLTCSSAPAAAITALTVLRVDLSPASADWIAGALARYYPGARVKDAYPLHPNPPTTTAGLGTSRALGAITFAPKDPGWYDVLAQVVQADGQTARVTYQVPVYLLESTTIR